MPAEHPTTLRPKSRRTWRAKLAIVVGVLALLVVAFVAFLHTPPARRFVLEQVTALLRQQNVSFSTDQLRYNLLDLSVHLRNLRIEPLAAAGLPPFAEIDSAEVDLSFVQLLRRRYVVQSGTLDGVRIHYYVAADGRDNLPRAPSDPNQPSQPLNYLVDSLGIRNARVRYENRVDGTDVQLPVRTVDVDGNPINDRHTVTLRGDTGTV